MRFVIRAVVIAIIHFGIAAGFVLAWSDATKAHDPMSWESFGFAAGAMAFATPLYQIPAARQFLPFVAGTAINSLLWGILLAIVFSRARRLWLLLLIPFLWSGGLMLAANLLEQRVDREWSALLSNRIPVTQRFPHQSANASAGRVDHLIDAMYADVDGVRSDLVKYIYDETNRVDDRIEPLPASVARLLVVHRFDIDALEAELLGGGPRWEVDLTATDRPDAIRYFYMQKVLLADALEAARTSDVAVARQRLQAAENLIAPLRARPEAVSLVAAMASGENQLGVARKLGVAPPPFDARDAVVNAFEGEAWTDRFLVATSRFDRDWDKRNAVSQELLTLFVQPYARICAAQAAAEQLENAVIVRNFPRCVFQMLPKYPDRHPFLASPIEVLTRATAASRAVRANRLLLDAEGTEKMAEARNSGAVTPSSMCPDRRWLFDGGVVHLEPPLPAGSALPPKQAINPEAPK